MYSIDNIEYTITVTLSTYLYSLGEVRLVTSYTYFKEVIMLVREPNSSSSNSKILNTNSLWKTFVGPLFAALLAGASAFIGMRQEMSVVTASVNKMSSTMDKIVDKQTTFFETFYVPLALKVEQHSSAINSLQMNDAAMREEIRYLHPNGRFSNGR